MLQHFTITKVAPTSIEAITCPNGGLNPSNYGNLSGTPVMLADKVVGSVSGVDINPTVGAVVIKVNVSDQDARLMANSGSLTAVEFDHSTKSVRLRDYVAKAASGTFELQLENGARLAKAFRHQMVTDDRESDLRLMQSLERAVYREPMNKNYGYSRRFAKPAPIDYSKFRKPGKDLIQNANARATSNSQFGPGLRANQSAENLAYASAEDRQRNADPMPEPYEPAPARASSTPASFDWPNGLPAAGASQSRTQLPNRNSRT